MANRSNASIIAGALGLLGLVFGVWTWLGRDAPEPLGTPPSVPSTRADSARGPSTTPRPRSDVDPWKAPRAAVTGTVRDPEGRPIAGAQVCARLDDDALAQAGRHPPRCATTREDGRYRVEGLLGAEHSLHAVARGFLPARYQARRGIQNALSGSLDLAAGVTREGLDFVLTPGGVEVSGVVKDIAGGVIEGAWISTRDRRWSRRGPVTFTRSDEDGRFTAWVDPPEVTIVAHAEGYTRASRSAAIPGTEVEVYLTPESVLVGKVVWADGGAPVEGARVDTSARLWGSPAGSVYSQSDGSFRIEGLEPGGYKVSVSGDELVGEASEKTHVGLAETSAPIVVEVHPAFAIRGTVLVDDQTPCSYGRVRATDTRHKTSQYASQPHEDGSVLIPGLLPGTYEITVSCDGFVPEPEYPDLVITDASHADLRWSVHPGQSIRGVVLDAEGQPVADARISARAKSSADPRAQRSSSRGQRTAADGRFELAGLLPGDYEVALSHPDHPRPDEPTTVTLPEGQDVNGLRVTFAGSGRVHGAVRDEQGVAVGGVTVGLRGPRWGGTATTNDEGRFTIEAVAAGDYRISARRSWSESMRAPGASDDDEAGQRIDVRIDEVTEVELVVESQSGRLTGRVHGEGGAPIADAFVEAIREQDGASASEGGGRQRVRWGSWTRQPVLTDEEGRFELTGLAAGAKYSVFANRKGGGEAIAEHVPEGSDVELAIAEVGVLAGVVRIEGGGAPERFRIVARDRSAGVYERDDFLRTDGRWRLTNLAPGTYEIDVDAAEGNAKTEVELGTGAEKTDVELVLAPRVDVRGRLIDAETGEPVPGLKVNVSGEAGTIMISDRGKADAPYISDRQGRFTYEDAPTGLVRVMIIAPSFADTPYDWTWMQLRLAPEPSEQDIGDIELVKRRVERGQEAGDIGFKTKESEPGTEPDDVRHVVAFVRPGGPAQAAGLAVGDEIRRIDGKDVTGFKSYLFDKLTKTAPGAALSLEVGSGEQSRTIRVTVGPPI